MPYPVFYKLTFQDTSNFYKLPIETIHRGVWEKEYTFDEKRCLPMLDCTQDNIISKKVFRFFDTPPYREVRDEEEEYNSIMSRHYIVLSDDCHNIESVYYDNKLLNSVEEDDIDVDTCLLITTLIK